jgi:NAD(P)-dependent dehydrogenase (short-subunit alcohol dehydrogenase family)
VAKNPSGSIPEAPNAEPHFFGDLFSAIGHGIGKVAVRQLAKALAPSIPEPQPFADLLSLKGRVAIITGGTRGLGSAMVRRFAEAGASVVVTGRGKPALKKIEAAIEAMGGTAVGVQADAGSVKDAQKVIDLAVKRFGRLDILVNNAAIFPPSISIEVTDTLWDQTIDTDLKGAFFLSKFAALEMIKGGRGGRIINVLSTEMIRPTGFLPAYGAAKGGLMAITQSMAKELGEHGILVNAVIPGATMTSERIDALKSGDLSGLAQGLPPEATQTRKKQRDMLLKGGFGQAMKRMPLGRTGYPDDLAKATLFLASDLATYVNGTSLLVDGGQTLS